MSDDGTGSGGSPNLIARFFDFETLIGAGLIKIVYYVGLAGSVLWALVALVGVQQSSVFMGGGAALIGLLAVVVGFVVWVVIWRFMCELWMVIFKIHDRLGDIRDRLPPKA